MNNQQSRNERKLLAIERAKFGLKQALERIDWNYDYLQPKAAEFKAQARLPELPSATIVEVVADEDQSPA